MSPLKPSPPMTMEDPEDRFETHYPHPGTALDRRAEGPWYVLPAHAWGRTPVRTAYHREGIVTVLLLCGQGWKLPSELGDSLAEEFFWTLTPNERDCWEKALFGPALAHSKERWPQCLDEAGGEPLLNRLELHPERERLANCLTGIFSDGGARWDRPGTDGLLPCHRLAHLNLMSSEAERARLLAQQTDELRDTVAHMPTQGAAKPRL